MSPSEAHDATAYDELTDLDEDRPEAQLADKGYDSDAIREDSWFHGTDPVIPEVTIRAWTTSADPTI